MNIKLSCKDTVSCVYHPLSLYEQLLRPGNIKQTEFNTIMPQGMIIICITSTASATVVCCKSCQIVGSWKLFVQFCTFQRHSTRPHAANIPTRPHLRKYTHCNFTFSGT